TAGKKIAAAREAVLKKLLSGKSVYEPGAGDPSLEKLSRFIDDDLPKAEADAIAAKVEESMAVTKAMGRIARLSGRVADAAVGTAAGGAPVSATARTARTTFSTRPTDTTGEVVVRGMPLQSFRVDVGGTPVDVMIEN